MNRNLNSNVDMTAENWNPFLLLRQEPYLIQAVPTAAAYSIQSYDNSTITIQYDS